MGLRQGRSSFGAFIRSPFGVKGNSLNSVFLMTATNGPFATKIWELDPDDYSIINSGDGPTSSNPSGGFLTFRLGGNFENLMFLDIYAGTISTLDTSDYSIIDTFAAPFSSLTNTATGGIGGNKDFVYAISGKGFVPHTIYSLDPETFSVLNSTTPTTRNYCGIGGNKDTIWTCEEHIATAGIRQFDPSSLALLNAYNFPLNDSVGIDGTLTKIRVVRGLTYSTTPDLNVYEYDGSFTLTDTKPIDAGVTGAIHSICGGNV